MKRLPNADAAIVDERKVTGYLLSTTHPFGRTKAEFFRQLGFATENWQVLRQALREHALNHSVESVQETPFGKKYIVNGPLATPSGKKAGGANDLVHRAGGAGTASCHSVSGRRR